MLIGEFFPPPGDAGEFHRDGPIALAVQEFQMPQQQTSLQVLIALLLLTPKDAPQVVM